MFRLWCAFACAINILCIILWLLVSRFFSHLTSGETALISRKINSSSWCCWQNRTCAVMNQLILTSPIFLTQPGPLLWKWLFYLVTFFSWKLSAAQQNYNMGNWELMDIELVLGSSQGSKKPAFRQIVAAVHTPMHIVSLSHIANYVLIFYSDLMKPSLCS